MGKVTECRCSHLFVTLEFRRLSRRKLEDEDTNPKKSIHNMLSLIEGMVWYLVNFIRYIRTESCLSGVHIHFFFSVNLCGLCRFRPLFSLRGLIELIRLILILQLVKVSNLGLYGIMPGTTNKTGSAPLGGTADWYCHRSRYLQFWVSDEMRASKTTLLDNRILLPYRLVYARQSMLESGGYVQLALICDGWISSQQPH